MLTRQATLRAIGVLAELERHYRALKVAGYGYREIGALTGASYTTVNRQLTRARARVKLATA